jgi:hypothetical protein
VETWGASSFENDPAIEWFHRVEEAVEPGELIAERLDHALSDAEYLALDPSREAIAAAELLASCAGQPPEVLPERIRDWAAAHHHEPHDSEIQHAVAAVARVRAESELRESWNQSGDEDEPGEGHAKAWLHEVDDLLARLRCSGVDSRVDSRRTAAAESQT